MVDEVENISSASFAFASRSGLGFWVHLVAILFKVVVSENQSEDLCFRSSRVKLPQPSRRVELLLQTSTVVLSCPPVSPHRNRLCFDPCFRFAVADGTKFISGFLCDSFGSCLFGEGVGSFVAWDVCMSCDPGEVDGALDLTSVLLDALTQCREVFWYCICVCCSEGALTVAENMQSAGEVSFSS